MTDVVDADMVKVHFTLDPKVDDRYEGAPGGESMWAKKVGPGRYRLDNLPSFAYGYAFRDVVRAKPKNGYPLEVTGIAESSGNRLYRFIQPVGSTFHAALKEKYDAAIEGGWETLISASIPGDKHRSVVSYLNAAVRTGKISAWEIGK